MKTVEVLFKEYDMLRNEILTAMSSRNTILSFGLATIGVIFSATSAVYTIKGVSLLSSLVLIFIIPVISTFVLFIWLGEYQRMHRAGKFLIELEARINEACKEELLSWETNLKVKKSHMRYPYDATIMLLTIIGLISISIGLIIIDINIPFSKFIFIPFGLLPQVAIYIYAITKMSELRL